MKKISTIKERILYYLENKGISKNKFYVKTGVSNGVLDKKGGLSGETIEKFIYIYTDINYEWLLTGNGSMLKGEIAVKSVDGKGIPLIPIDAMAGFGSGDAQIFDYECEKFVVPTFKDASYLIGVRGGSMYPKYSSGDIIACKHLPLEDIFFQWNKVYVLDTDQGPLIKRVCKGKDDKHIKLVSENTQYEPFDIAIKKIRAVALVIGVIRLE